MMTNTMYDLLNKFGGILMSNFLAYEIGGSLLPSLIFWAVSIIILNILHHRFISTKIKTLNLFILIWTIIATASVMNIVQVSFFTNIAIKLLLFSAFLWIFERVV